MATATCASSAATVGLRYSGSAPVRILAVDKLPNVFSRAEEFMNVTGATLQLTEESIGSWPGALWSDTGSISDSDAPALFDAFTVKGNWVPELAHVGALEDLTPYVSEGDRWTSLDWTDINPFVRDTVCEYDNKIYTLPVDSDWMLTIVRPDLLEEHGIDVPGTWDDFAEAAEYFDGLDLNGDGEADYGVCFGNGPKGSSHFLPFISFYTVMAPYLQRKTSDGLFFNTLTGAPRFDTPEFRQGLAMFKRLQASFQPFDASGPAAKNLFTSGRCALWMTLPGLAKGVSGGSGALVNGTNMLRINTPGAVMTNADTTTEVVTAPFFGTGGIATAVSARATDEAKQIAFDFLNYLSSPLQANEDVVMSSTWSDPFRKSQLSEEVGNPKQLLRDNGWLGEDDIAAYLDVTQWAQSHENAAVDLRIPGATLYFESLEAAVEAYVYNATTRDVMTEDEFVAQVTAAWDEVPSEVFPDSDETAAKNEMLNFYRRSLGLPPILLDADIAIAGNKIDEANVAIVAVVCFAVLVPAAALITKKFSSVTNLLIKIMMFDTALSVFMVLLDALDVASDYVACHNVLEDEHLERYHGAYLNVTILSMIVGGIGICFKIVFLKRSVAKQSETHGTDKAAMNAYKIKGIDREIKGLVVSLAVFFLEDLPMSYLSISMLFETVTSDGDAMGEASKQALLLSVTMSLALCGLKLGTSRRILDLYNFKGSLNGEARWASE